MDYLVVYIAWDLDLRDLKKLSLNGITYSSVDADKQRHIKNDIFKKKWNEFIEYLLEKFTTE